MTKGEEVKDPMERGLSIDGLELDGINKVDESNGGSRRGLWVCSKD